MTRSRMVWGTSSGAGKNFLTWREHGLPEEDGVSAHGLFESPAVLRALFGTVRSLDASLDGLADGLDRHFAPGVLHRVPPG